MVSIVNAVKDLDRLRQITGVLVKHGFGEIVARIGLGSGAKPSDEAEGAREKKRITFAERLRLVLQELGPSFVKLGQIASTRSDLLPADVIVELKKLQDDVPPIPIEEVRAAIQETLGAPPSEIFRDFDEAPLACASIGQVHVAKLVVGDEPHDVVVKVQRPRIRNTIERDLDLLYFLARVLERAVPESRVYSPVGLVGEFDRAITAELDYTIEADNAEKFAQHFAESALARFPRIYRQASGKKVLTLELFRGKKVYDAVAAGASGETIAKNALAVIAQMIFEDGFFHADPHPGNVIILGEPAAPVIGLIDLGLVGRLSQEMRDKAVDLMVAAVRQEPDALAEALLALGKPRGKVDLAAFRAEVAVLSEKYLGKPLAEVQLSALIRDLVQGAVKYEIDMPTELVMVGKALMTVEGVGKEIHPELDVWTEMRPYFLRLIWRRYHPERIGRELLRALAQLGTTASSLPKQVHTILEDLRKGDLVVKAPDPQLPGAADRLGRRLFSGIVVASLVLTGGMLTATGHGSQAVWFWAGAGAIAAVHWIGDLRRKK